MAEKQSDFWSHNPCGADGNLSEIIRQRYSIDFWLPRDLQNFPTDRKNYLEVGCGQGVDSLYLCAHLNKDSKYTAIDFSSESINRAKGHLEEAKKSMDMNIVPVFSTGDALALSFDDNEFDFVYSMGVLHHTPDPQKAINEIYRVLGVGGRAVIFLYRRNSLKVGVAKFLRSIQFVVDKLFFGDRIIYKIIKRKKSRLFGSMFLECFGVPWMEWYSEKELKVMFGEFKTVNIDPYGYNFPKFRNKNLTGYNRRGHFYKIDVIK